MLSVERDFGSKGKRLWGGGWCGRQGGHQECFSLGRKAWTEVIFPLASALPIICLPRNQLPGLLGLRTFSFALRHGSPVGALWNSWDPSLS